MDGSAFKILSRSPANGKAATKARCGISDWSDVGIKFDGGDWMLAALRICGVETWQYTGIDAAFEVRAEITV